MNKQLIQNTADILATLTADDFKAVTLEGIDFAQDSVAAQQVRHELSGILSNKLNAGGVTSIPSEMLETVTEDILDMLTVNGDTINKQAAVNNGISDTKITIENFDNSWVSNMCGIFTAYNLMSTNVLPYRAKSEKIFPKVNLKNGEVNESFQIPFEQSSLRHHKATANNPVKMPLAKVLRSGYTFNNVTLQPVPFDDATNGNLDMFPDPLKIAPWESTTIDDEVIETAPILCGKEVDFFSLATTPEMRARGEEYTSEDEIDDSVNVGAVYIEFDGEILVFDTSNYLSSNFYPAQQGSTSVVLASLDIDAVVDANTLTLAGTPVTKLTIPADHHITLRIKLSCNLDIRTATFSSSVPTVELVSVFNADGQPLPDTDAIVTTLVTEVEKVKDSSDLAIYPQVLAQNSNMRKEGPFLDFETSTYSNKTHPMPPVSIRQPVNRETYSEAAALMATFNDSRVASEALKTLLGFAREVKIHTRNGSTPSAIVPSLASGDLSMVYTTYAAATVDLKEGLNSVRHQDRLDDLGMLIGGNLEVLARKAFIQSGLSDITAVFNRKYAVKPTAVVVTNPITGALLKNVVDKMDSDFKWDIVIFPHDELVGRAIVVFNFSKGSHPLNFGYTGRGKDLVYPSTVTRYNSTKSVIVAREFTNHAVRTPVLAELFVENENDYLGKVTVLNEDA